MKVLVAIDSFKGSLSSLEAGKAIKEGIKRIDDQVKIVVCPLADGGEGTVEALVEGMNGTYQDVTVCGPLTESVECRYGILTETKTAIIEMASAAGITLVPVDERNPMNTTTYGVGQMIKDAIAKGCRRFLIGIGGSATNDCGIGMLQALGFEFLDVAGRQVPFGAKGISDIVKISDECIIPELRECTFHIACDVTNPLCGENGCSAVYGPQKGATPKMIHDMDEWIDDFATLTKRTYPNADPKFPGTGAAGGLGFAFLTFLNAVLESGIQIVMKETKLVDHMKDADLVITGEGRLDGQTAMGKAPIGVAKLAKVYQKNVIAFAGGVSKDAVRCNQEGIDAFFPILRDITTLEDAMKKENAATNLRDAAEQVFRLYKVIKVD